jgi:hypothetical protein
MTPLPGTKSPEIEELLENIAGRTTAQAGGTCVRPPIGCGKPIKGFKNSISAREYSISGFCQACQDDTFGEDSTDEYGEATLQDIADAQAAGLTVFDFTRAYGRVISLDLDGPFNYVSLPDNIFFTTSKSGRRHGFYTEPPTTNTAHFDQERAAVGYGSDPVREKVSFATYQRGLNPFAYLTFETDEAASHLRAWLALLPAKYAGLVRELPKVGLADLTLEDEF